MDSLSDPEVFGRGIAELTDQDAVLREIVDRCGVPEPWHRDPGFATLVRIILEQAVSLASGKAVYERLESEAGGVTPSGVMELGEERLRAAGLSRQKADFCLGLARAVCSGALNLDALAHVSDDEALATLTAQRGIGPWTAEIYLMAALGRPDVWPAGDLALAVAALEVYGLDERPKPAPLRRLAEPWRPWRTLAAQILWQHYLQTPRLRTPRSS